MPLKLLSPGGGSVLLQANTTSLDYTLTVPAETANLITTATTSGINASAISVGTLSSSRLPSSGISATSLTTGTLPTARLPAGCILQVQQAFYSTATTLASSSFVDYPGLSITITPSSSTSKFLLMYHLQFSQLINTVQARFVRDSTPVGIGDASSSRTRTTTGWLWPTTDGNHQACPMSAWYLDSPSTSSAITYKVQGKTQSAGTAYINRSANDADNGDWSHRSTSSFTIFEVAV